MVELYSRSISPFAARVRVSILAKGLPVRIIDNPDVNAQQFATLNPLRRVPVLVLDDGSAIPESDVIVEYLEDAYPQVPLRPPASHDRAQVRLIARVAELYVFPAAVPIFAARAGGDAKQITSLFEHLDQALGSLASVLPRSQRWQAFGNTLSTADGALAAFLFYVVFLGRACDRDSLASHGRLKTFWHGAQNDPVLSTVIGQMADAMTSRQRTGATAAS